MRPENTLYTPEATLMFQCARTSVDTADEMLNMSSGLQWKVGWLVDGMVGLLVVRVLHKTSTRSYQDEYSLVTVHTHGDFILLPN